MNPGRFFMPGMGSNIGPMMTMGFPTRNVGLFGRLTNSIKSFNWSGLLNGANKTLNVVNQTIPLVRQAGPMFNNMKSMMRIAKVFGNETTSRSLNSKTNNSTPTNNISHNQNEQSNQKKEVQDNNYPNFFI